MLSNEMIKNDERIQKTKKQWREGEKIVNSRGKVWKKFVFDSCYFCLVFLWFDMKFKIENLLCCLLKFHNSKYLWCFCQLWNDALRCEDDSWWWLKKKYEIEKIRKCFGFLNLHLNKEMEIWRRKRLCRKIAYVCTFKKIVVWCFWIEKAKKIQIKRKLNSDKKFSKISKIQSFQMIK